MVGPSWPNEGEIDIIEGVNENSNNAMTLHTSDGCSITNNNAFSGTLTTTDCYINAPGQISNAGCDIQDQRSSSYGNILNANGGGVYATQWTSSDINIWFFPRQSIPANVASSDPDPTTWGQPVAQFQGGCNIDAHFQNLQMVCLLFTNQGYTDPQSYMSRFSIPPFAATGPVTFGAPVLVQT